MSLVPCPGCSLPRTVADAERECPVCGHVPASKPAAVPAAAVVPSPPTPRAVPRPPVPRPADSAGPPLLPWVLAGVGFGGTIVCAVGWSLAVLDRSPAPEVAVPRNHAGPLAREVAPTPRRVPDPPELAPPPRASVAPRNPWRVDGGAVPPGGAANDAPFEVIRVDAPAEDFRLDPVDGKRRIKLVGVANKLFLASVTGGAVVDASELDTRWVNVTGRIDDGAAVRIAAPGGLVNFTEGVGGGATVIVSAPAGTVTFAKRGTPKVKVAAQPTISGGARVAITGRAVTFLSPIVGDATTVDVTLSTRGHLLFAELDDGAKLLYRPAKPADPPLIINPGLVKGDADFRRVE